MANNLIQIKRSLNTAVPASLQNGELAFTANGDVLYIGSNGSVEPIGGKRSPGVLSANQALVANSTSGIDKVITANAVVTTLWANGGSGSSGQLLTSNGSAAYWSTPAPSVVGSDTQVQYNDNGSLGAAGGLTFSKTTNNVTVANTLNVTGGLNVTGSINRNPVITLGGDLSGSVTLSDLQSGTLTATIVADSVALGTDTTGNYVATIATGVGLSGSGTTEASTPTIAVVANNGIVANSSGVFALAANGISVDSSGINVVGGNGLVSNASGVHIVSGNGISVSADAIDITTGSTLTVNTSGIHVNSALSITDLSLSGNLTVLGTLTTVDSTNLTVKDALLELANGNVTTDILDIGLYGQYGTDSARFTGFFRDASDGIYKLFANSTVEPTSTVDTGAIGYEPGTLQAWLNSGAFVSNSSTTAITANSTVSVSIAANTLSLSTALAGTSGGTGLSSYTVEDIIVANSSNGFRSLSLGTSGYVLQSNGSALLYDSLDGGTF